MDREAIARIIDPSKWRVLDNYLASTIKKYKGQNVGYDPDTFKDQASLAKADEIIDLTRTEAMGHTPKRGDKIKWARGLERRPLAVRDLEFVTVASWGLPGMPLVVTLQEVAGSFPMGLFDRVDPVEDEMDA